METCSALLALCDGNPPVTGGVPSQRPVTWSFDVSLIRAWTNGWANNRGAGDLRRHRANYDVTIMLIPKESCRPNSPPPSMYCLFARKVPMQSTDGRSWLTWSFCRTNNRRLLAVGRSFCCANFTHPLFFSGGSEVCVCVCVCVCLCVCEMGELEYGCGNKIYCDD